MEDITQGIADPKMRPEIELVASFHEKSLQVHPWKTRFNIAKRFKENVRCSLELSGETTIMIMNITYR
jgi:hypothetical protein